MSLPFDSARFLTKIGESLIFEFEHASQAGTPELKGDAREHPARRKLEQVLRGFIEIGSGQIIDSFGSISRQQDIVIFERDFCPRFSINDTPSATYYPIEGTVAVGEVKSTLSLKELKDSFAKIESAKSLRRYTYPVNINDFRRYGSGLTISGANDERLDFVKKYQDQVFGFILCNTFASSPRTMLNNCTKLWSNVPGHLCPNFIVSLNQGIIVRFNQRTGHFSSFGGDATASCFYPTTDDGFPNLVRLLRDIIYHGRNIFSI